MRSNEEARAKAAEIRAAQAKIEADKKAGRMVPHIHTKTDCKGCQR